MKYECQDNTTIVKRYFNFYPSISSKLHQLRNDTVFILEFFEIAYLSLVTKKRN